MRALPLVCVLAASCAPAAPSLPQPQPWAPGTALRSPPGPRGLVDARGVIHSHSVRSHDACDGEPLVDGGPNEACFDSFRAGICASRHDFVMLTDHRDSFVSTEFPEALLYRPDRGDVLVERDGAPVANRLACPDGSEVLVLAGTEAGTMPVGLEGHAAPQAERDALYGARDAASLDRLRAQGAVILLAHPEDFTIEELIALPVDGFEMFNLHANTFLGMGAALELLVRMNDGDTELPHPDLFLLPILSEDPRYLARWSAALAAGEDPTTTIGTDCHENTFKAVAADGERVDSYRRMMTWMSNHLLVRDDVVDPDQALKEALRAHRVYGAFEVLGYPTGFDFHAQDGDDVVEIGGRAAPGAHLVVKMPRVRMLDDDAEPPTLTARILRATPEGFVEVAAGAGDLDVVVDEPGAYRAEIRMVPLHLRAALADDARSVLARDYVWIYANAIRLD
jgi:hypothetical protein